MNKTIETERLILTACTLEILEAILKGNNAIATLLQVNVPDDWTEFGEPIFNFTREKLLQSADEHGWWAFLPIYKPDNMLAGSCGYKGKPDINGMVEIGYEVAPHYRNRGLATELAKALITHAFAFEEVKLVQAHTLAEENASGKVLHRCGMVKVAEINDPEDGKLWRWELPENRYKGY